MPRSSRAVPASRRVRADRDHTLCFQCSRAERNRQCARLTAIRQIGATLKRAQSRDLRHARADAGRM